MIKSYRLYKGGSDMIELEAREKWCPMARVPIASEAYLNFYATLRRGLK